MKLKIYHLFLLVLVVAGALTFANIITPQAAILSTLFVGGIFRINQLKRKFKDSEIFAIKDQIEMSAKINNLKSQNGQLLEKLDESLLCTEASMALNKVLLEELNKKCDACNKDEIDENTQEVEPVEQKPKTKKPRSKKPKNDEII